MSESDRLLADGVPLQLVDGEALLKFTNLALMRLENHFGSFEAVVEHLNGMTSSAIEGLKRPVMGDLGVFLGAALDVTPEEAISRLPEGKLHVTLLEASTACIRAWMCHTPPPSAEGNEEPVAPAESPGETSTSSSPSSADELTPSSV